MRNILKYGILVILCWIPILASSQLKDSSRTALHLGFLRNTVDPFSEGTVTVERSVWKRISLLGSIGLNPTSERGYIFPIWRFYWQVSVEARYYYALRRKYLMSGFYAGLYLCHDNKSFYYDGTWNPYYHGYFSSAGPLIGYQHAFGTRIRAGWGFTTVFYPKQYEDFYDAQERLISRTVWPANYTFYTFFRLGITL